MATVNFLRIFFLVYFIIYLLFFVCLFFAYRYKIAIVFLLYSLPPPRKEKTAGCGSKSYVRARGLGWTDRSIAHHRVRRQSAVDHLPTHPQRQVWHDIGLHQILETRGRAPLNLGRGGHDLRQASGRVSLLHGQVHRHERLL